jgi:hypothetical protein
LILVAETLGPATVGATFVPGAGPAIVTSALVQLDPNG